VEVLREGLMSTSEEGKVLRLLSKSVDSL
jgi:hypothetical protein